MKRLSGVGVAAVLALCAPTLAHPTDSDGHHDQSEHHVDPAKIRKWTNAKTGETVRGAFLAARTVDGVVRVSIERENGDVVSFPLAELTPADRVEAQRRIDEVKATNEQLFAAARVRKPGEPLQAAPFEAFAPFVTTRWDERWLYVESDGLPHVPGGDGSSFVFSHPMMVGITAWQQQVPLPQDYHGSNAWQIPLKPEMADAPVSAKEQLFRGAIALAANGVPIFNPIKNDGRTDTYLAGELDEFGGHCGRADDYHYHIAPTHLQRYVGKGEPIAYALDGFPIYGAFDPGAKGEEEKACPLGGTERLDELNGHYGAPAGGAPAGAKGLYHYHASARYPYLNGGMRGKVVVKGDQIDPQPRTTPVRDWLQPLRGARITGLRATGKDADRAWSLEYTISGKRGFVNYRIVGEGRDVQYVFEFVGTDGTKETKTYTAGEQGRGNRPGREPAGGDRPRRDGPRRDEQGREGGDGRGGPRGDRPPPPPESDQNAAPAATPTTNDLGLSSADVASGRLSIECSCDGKGRAPSLAWGDPPDGTKAFAIVMHHVPPDGGTHVYMVVANIPATARELKSGDVTTGVWGQNTVNHRNEYTPPCSKGPGDKSYTVTIYALSGEVSVGAALTRESLLATIKDSTLATGSLNATYARSDR